MKEFNITVTIREGENGLVFSSQCFSTLDDEKVASSLPGGGLRQIAFAFLVEAARRESFVSALVKMTAESEYLDEWKAADWVGRRKIEEKLGHAVRALMSNTLLKLVPGAAREVLERLSGDTKADSQTPADE